MTKINRKLGIRLITGREERPARSRAGRPGVSRALYDLMREHQACGRPVVPARVSPERVRGADGRVSVRFTKRPVVKWREFQSRVPTLEEIDGWQRSGRVSMNAAAMVTGRISMVWVLDGDCPEALEWMRANVPETPVRSKTMKGEHWYYRCPEEGYIRSDVDVLRGSPRGVDIRGEGSLIMLPPSVYDYHRGVHYQWLCGTPGPADWLSLPVWGGPQGACPDHPGEPAGGLPGEPAVPLDLDGDLAIAEGAGRNTALTSRVGTWVWQRHSRAAVLAAARDWNGAHCRPPLPEREVGAIVESIWGRDARKGARPPAPGEAQGVLFTEPPPKGVRTESESDAPPAALLNPGGIMQMFMDYVTASSAVDIPFFSVGGALALIGTVMGGKVATETGLKTNFYIIALAPSGDGKNAVLSALKRILSPQGAPCLKQYKGASSLASDAALYSNLCLSPVQLMTFDELGDFMNIARRGGGSTTGVPKALKELFTCTDLGYVKQFADRTKNFEIVWHNLSFYGAGVPNTFWDSLTVQDIADGYLSRNLIFQHSSKTMPIPRDRVQTALPKAFMDGLLGLKGVKFVKESRPLHAMLPTPHVVVKSAEAQALVMEAKVRYDSLARSRQDEKNSVYTLYTRIAEYIEKIALVHAVSLSGGVPERISLESAEYAVGLVDFLAPRLRAAAERNVAFNPQDGLRRRILDMILHRGHVGVRDVYKKIEDCDSRQAEDALKILVNQGRIVKGVYKGRTQYRRLGDEAWS
jgi:hypothetical protein